MIIVGLVFVIAGTVFGIDVATKNRFTVGDIEVFGNTLGLHHAEQIFLLGAVTGAVILLGLALLIAGIVRSRTKNVVHRRQPRGYEETNQRAADLDARHQNSSPAAEQRSPTSGEDADGASVVDAKQSGGRESRVSSGSGGSTALGPDA